MAANKMNSEQYVATFIFSFYEKSKEWMDDDLESFIYASTGASIGTVAAILSSFFVGSAATAIPVGTAAGLLVGVTLLAWKRSMYATDIDEIEAEAARVDVML